MLVFRGLLTGRVMLPLAVDQTAAAAGLQWPRTFPLVISGGREMGHDPVEVCRYFGSRDCINHVHFRNVRTRVPREKYTEVFLDEGEVNMIGVMKELVRQKYPRLIYPEHPPLIDADRENPFKGISSQSYAGFAYTVGYARAALQAALQ